MDKSRLPTDKLNINLEYLNMLHLFGIWKYENNKSNMRFAQRLVVKKMKRKSFQTIQPTQITTHLYFIRVGLYNYTSF